MEVAVLLQTPQERPEEEPEQPHAPRVSREVDAQLAPLQAGARPQGEQAHLVAVVAHEDEGCGQRDGSVVDLQCDVEEREASERRPHRR